MPTFHTRRSFLRTSILGGAVAWTLPSFIDRTFAAMDAQVAGSAVQTVTGRDGPILVVVQLAGGNDGLNTLVPFRDDSYYKARPSLAVPGRSVLRLSDEIGLNPAMSEFARLFEDGGAAVVQGVGYPNPNRSHFRSTEIWQTATDADRTARHGWIGRYFDNCCEGDDPAIGVTFGSRAPQAFAAQSPRGIVMENPERFRLDDDVEVALENEGGSIDMLEGGMASDEDTFQFIERVALGAQVASDRIAGIVKKHRPTTRFPTSRLGRDFQLVSQLIAGGMPTRIYYLSLGGFDTHANQSGSHERLLRQLDEALGAFVAEMKAQGNFDRVLLMTFSEFGRRVAENGSGGTDHGAAAPMFLAGGMLRPGIFGKAPDLTDLRGGDLQFNVDFRSVYATVLEKWLHAPADSVLGRPFPLLDFV